MRSDSANCDKSQIGVFVILAPPYRKSLAASNEAIGNTVSITVRRILYNLRVVYIKLILQTVISYYH